MFGRGWRRTLALGREQQDACWSLKAHKKKKKTLSKTFKTDTLQKHIEEVKIGIMCTFQPAAAFGANWKCLEEDCLHNKLHCSNRPDVEKVCLLLQSAAIKKGLDIGQVPTIKREKDGFDNSTELPIQCNYISLKLIKSIDVTFEYNNMNGSKRTRGLLAQKETTKNQWDLLNDRRIKVPG